MRTKRLLTILIILCSLNVFGQQVKKESASKKDEQIEIIYNLQLKIDNQHEMILKLSADNQAMQKQIDVLENDVERYREDVRANDSEMNTNMALWFGALTLVMAILGVAVPLILNQKNEKNVEKLLEDTKKEAKEAKEQAQQAKQAVSDIEELKTNINSIEEKVNKYSEDAEEAAKRAKASELFTQALSEKDPKKAIELYSKSIDMHPNAESYNNRGILKADLKDAEGAIKDYDKAIELDSSDSFYYYNRGISKVEIKDNKGAMKDYNRAIELDPNYVYGYNNRGILKKDLGDVEGAMKDYNKAIELDANYARAYNNRADLWLIIGDIGNALDDINKSISIDNSEFVSFITRGEIYCADKQYDLAIEDFSHVISLSNKTKAAYKNRAQCYRKLAESEQDPTKKADFIAKALADEEKAKSLGDEE